MFDTEEVNSSWKRYETIAYCRQLETITFVLEIRQATGSQTSCLGDSRRPQNPPRYQGDKCVVTSRKETDYVTAYLFLVTYDSGFLKRQTVQSTSPLRGLPQTDGAGLAVRWCAHLPTRARGNHRPARSGSWKTRERNALGVNAQFVQLPVEVSDKEAETDHLAMWEQEWKTAVSPRQPW